MSCIYSWLNGQLCVAARACRQHTSKAAIQGMFDLATSAFDSRTQVDVTATCLHSAQQRKWVGRSDMFTAD